MHGMRTKEYLMIWSMFWSFSGSEGPPTSPQGPKWSQMDDLLFHEKSRYKIALWDKSTMGNWVLVPWKAVKGISDDLRHALVIFWFKGGPHDPPPQGPRQFQMDDLVFPFFKGFNLRLTTTFWLNLFRSYGQKKPNVKTTFFPFFQK